MRDRAAIETMVENTAVAAAGAAARAITPPGLTDEVQQLIASSAEQVTKIIATNGPSIIQALCTRALDGDTNAAALLTKFIVSPKTKIKLDAPQGGTIEEFADSVISQTVAGTLAIEDGEAFLRLAERHSAVTLNGSLVGRLEALTTRLNEAKAQNLVQADVTIARPVITLEAFLEHQQRSRTPCHRGG